MARAISGAICSLMVKVKEFTAFLYPLLNTAGRGGNEKQSGGEVLKAWQLCDRERFRRDEQAVED